MTEKKCWVLLNDKNVVIGKDIISNDGWIETSDDIVCGQIRQKDGSFKNPEPSSENVKALKDAQMQSAFSLESDPLFFKWQAGEISKDEWLEKREEIRGRFE